MRCVGPRRCLVDGGYEDEGFGWVVGVDAVVFEDHAGGGEVAGDLVVQPALTALTRFKTVDLGQVFIARVTGGIHVMFVIGAFRGAHDVSAEVDVWASTVRSVVSDAEFDADVFVPFDDDGVVGGGEDVVHIR